MKKIIGILCVYCLSIGGIQAQKIEENPLYARAGFKGGIGYNTVTGLSGDIQGRTRVHLGVVVEYPISSTFFLQGELLYSAQGFTSESEEGDIDVGLNYLNLPFLGKLFVTNNIAIETGPQFGLLSNITSMDVEDDSQLFDSFDDFDLSWIAGVSYKLKSGMFFQLRYNLGLTTINSDNGIFADEDVRNSVAQFSIGYLFKTKNNRRIIQGEEESF